jgi:hypothetical protein
MSQVLQGAFPQDANPGMSVLQQNGTWAFDETYRLECVKEEGKNPDISDISKFCLLCLGSLIFLLPKTFKLLSFGFQSFDEGYSIN